jgi:hypothetical protein
MADFKLGRIKFKWRGDWATSTSYLVDDIAKFGGNTYVCTTSHTSTSSESNFYSSDLSNWSLHTEGLYFKGDWTGSTFYKLNDLVKYGAYQYRTTTSHTSTSNFDNTKFEVYAEGLQWEDSYNAGTTYQDGDVVTYGGYTYVYINSSPSSGNTPTDDSFWDVITTGYNNTGTYSHGTTYKTGDVVRYGGNSYVAVANHTNEYPAVQATGATNTSYWELIISGFNNRGAYNSLTTYNIGDVVRYTNSSYVQLKDRQSNVEPGTDGSVWQILAEGDPTAVTQNRGDLIYRDATASARLPIGVSGAVLTTDGTDPIWSNAEGRNVIYVANSGSDTNPGTQFLPYKTVSKALSVATSGDVVDFNTITGGTGGTPGTYDVVQSSTTGSGTSAQIRTVNDGSSVPTVTIINGGSGHAAGDVITFSGGDIGGSSNITITVVSASIGDVVYVKNGVYRETLPLRIPSGVTVQGESLRGTEIRPASGNSTQVATINSIAGGTGGTPGTYNYVHQTSSTQNGDGIVVNVTTDGSSTPTVTIYHGGYGYTNAETITIAGSDIGGATDLTFNVASFETNSAANMFLLNNTTNLVQMSMRGLTGTPTAGGTSKAAVTSLDPEGSITVSSPYIQNCSSINTGATGIQIDGNLHSAGNKSILANDFTQINSDGIGVHALARGRGEMVSIFTYYCAKSFYAQSGGFIRGLNCSSAYGEKGAEADGTDIDETSVHITTRGEILSYDPLTFVGAASEADIADMIATSGSGTATISGDTSGATATIFRTNTSLDYIHIENRTGNFQQGETVTITKENSSTFQVDLDSSFGAPSVAQTGQIGPLIAVASGTTALSSANIIKVGTNILFSGDSTYYRISAVTEENTSDETALIRLTASITSGNAKADNTSADVTENFSNVRLTGHDFLDIGTGDIASTNYPGGPSQPADQSDEITETNGGRVYFVSSDQKGDFRVGDLFRIEQATGVATLNADAFDLSGLTELQLGSIGAQIGATINEFSVDETLSGNSNIAVPTERAVKQYVDSTDRITSKTELSSAAADDVLLIYDTDAGVIKKIQKDNLSPVINLTYNTRTATGDGSTLAFTVTNGQTSDSVIVTENGIVQAPTADYSVSGTTLTFTTAPASGVNIKILELPVQGS